MLVHILITLKAAAQFLEQYFSNGDLSEFMTMFVGNDFPHRNTIDKIIGRNDAPASIDASLGTQYIMGLGANISTWFWSTAGRHHENHEPFLQWLLNIGNTTRIPLVHSVGYADKEIKLSKSYMVRGKSHQRVCETRRGITILVASGDNGAGCYMHHIILIQTFPYQAHM